MTAGPILIVPHGHRQLADGEHRVFEGLRGLAFCDRAANAS
jgi:hypothetical protein